MSIEHKTYDVEISELNSGDFMYELYLRNQVVIGYRPNLKSCREAAMEERRFARKMGL